MQGDLESGGGGAQKRILIETLNGNSNRLIMNLGAANVCDFASEETAEFLFLDAIFGYSSQYDWKIQHHYVGDFVPTI